MTTLLENQARQRLVRVRDLYAQIAAITDAYAREGEGEEFEAVVGRREALFEEIRNEERAIEEMGVPPETARTPAFRSLRDDIVRLLHVIVVLDSTVTNRVRNVMAGISAELSSLYSSGKAAHAYAVQRR